MEYDVFISFAVEDKASVAMPLVKQLQARGVRVWFSSNQLQVGDRLADALNEGLRKARYGVVLLSPRYLEKEWTRNELNAFMAKEVNQGPLLLPVWHQLSYEQLRQQHPLLADRVALNTGQGIEAVADAITAKVLKNMNRATAPVSPSQGKTGTGKTGLIGALLFLALLVVGYLWFRAGTGQALPEIAQLMPAIQQYTEQQQKHWYNELQQHVAANQGHATTQDSLLALYDSVAALEKGIDKAEKQNVYSFTNGDTTVFNVKNLRSLGIQSPNNYSPLQQFSFEQATAWLVKPVQKFPINQGFTFQYAFVNAKPVAPQIDSMAWAGEGQLLVWVSYSQWCRGGTYTFYWHPAHNKTEPRHKVEYWGLMPKECLRLVKVNATWQQVK